MRKIIASMILAILAIVTGWAQLPSSFPPKSYPASIMVVTDPGVKQYWDVKRIMYLGPGKGGHKFRVFGTGMKDMPATNIDMFYIRHDDQLQSAGAYFFPAIKAGEAFNFDIVSAFPGYAPSKFLGFMIKDDRFTVQKEAPSVSSQGSTSSNPQGNASTADRDEIRISREEDSNEVCENVEVCASFPGGMPALARWLSSNVRYPESCEKKGTEGKVVVNFIIEKDGSISKPHVVKSIDPDLDREALRVVGKMPKWNPGTNNGKPVRSYFNLPVNFRLVSQKK